MLESHGLKIEHFENVDAALEAAQKLLDAFIAQKPEMQEKYPPKLFEDKRLSKWYFESEISATGNLFFHKKYVKMHMRI